MSQKGEASEADDIVLASGGSDAAYVANERRGADDARGPGVSSDGRRPKQLWDPVPILTMQTYNVRAKLEEATIACPKCNEEGVNISCLGVKQLNNHVIKEHSGAQISWICDQCDKTFSKLHSWRCHFPKCKGEQGNTYEYKCDNCPMAFKTKSELSQHERHTHPETRNKKRTTEAEGPIEKGRKTLKVWAADELERLERLSIEHQGERNINVRLMEFFPGRTNKQISDARRRIKSLTDTREQPDDNTSPRADSPDSEPENIELQRQVTIENEPRNDISQRQIADESEDWREALRTEIAEKCCVPEKWQTIVDTIAKLEGKAVQAEEIDSMYNSIVEQLNIPKEEIATRTTKKSKRQSGGTGKPNRLAKRRYAYAKCQELINKCPKKLAEAVTANDFSVLQLRQAPGITEVKELYTNLWGICGPKQVLSTIPEQ